MGVPISQLYEAMAIKNALVLVPKFPSFLHGVKMMGTGGKGAGGSIQDAGGKMAEMGAAKEDEYFRRLQAQQLESLKSHVDEEILNHKHEIDHHLQEIERHKLKLSQLEKAKAED